MVFTIPRFRALAESSDKLFNSYTTQRSLKDKNRFLGSFLPSTNNQDRWSAVHFIQKIAKHVYDSNNKLHYSTVDPAFMGKDYETFVAPFLRDVVSGAFLLELIKISKKNKTSVLGDIILHLFKIEKVSEVPQEDLIRCLTNLHHFLEVMENAPKNSLLLWHESLTDKELRQQVEGELKQLKEGLTAAL